MYSAEQNIAPRSPYFVYTPSAMARKLFFYPTAIGHFRYLPGYRQKRGNYDSFLYLLVEEGTFHILLNGISRTVTPGALVLLNCHEPHEYGSNEGCKILWLHFDGPLAGAYYEHITQLFGNILHPQDFPALHCQLEKLLQHFAEKDIADESAMSMQITRLLNPLLQPTTQKTADSSSSNTAIRRALNHILSHFHEDIDLATLASIAGLSPYHFSRVFKAELGATPHQYIIMTRISTARYLLSATERTVSEIAFEVGFKDESSFCLTFRKRTGQTPTEFRASTGEGHTM